jgi:hypothetical protein
MFFPGSEFPFAYGWDRAVEHDTVRPILVEAAVNEIAQIAPALRVTLRERAGEHRPASRRQRVGRSGIVGGRVACERDDVAGGGETDAGDRRVGLDQ